MKRVGPWIALSVSLIFSGWILFFSLRLIFFSVHWGTFHSLSQSNLIRAFLHGWRFDTAAISQLLLPSILIAIFLKNAASSLFLRRTIELIMIVPFLLAILIYGTDIHYFADAGRRLSYEVFLLQHDVPAVARMASSYVFSLVIVLISMGTLLGVWLKWAAFVEKRCNPHPTTVSHITCVCALTVFMIIGLRGGLQSKPLRPSFAFFSTDQNAGQLALNPVYTVIHALRKGEVQAPKFMPSEEAIDKVHVLLKQKGWDFPDPNFPLLQIPVKPAAAHNRPNIVVMVLESWSGAFVGVLNKGIGVTPNFDALAARGILFENFFSAGHRSTDGITAVCLGLPTFEDLQIIGTNLEQNRYRGLGHIMTENGYSTLFLHGAKTGSMGLNGFSRVAGFERYIGKEDLKLGPNEADRTWGAFDHVALRRLNEEIRSMKSPFMALWFSLSSHSPYELPSPKYSVTPSSVPDHEFMDSLRYSDESLGLFFAAVEKEAYFKNTIFILVADHTAGSTLKDTYERYRIPLLIYAPGLLSPKRISDVGSQLDILPTIMALSNANSSHHAMGRSLLEPVQDRSAFFDMGYSQGFFQKDGISHLSGNEGPRDLKAFVQVAKDTILKNQLCPAQ